MSGEERKARTPISGGTAVSYFSGRNLTYGKDRLPAISGLAAEMHPLTDDKYSAGIWEEDLLNGLCWRLYPGSVLGPLRYRAPSWSWASIDWKIEYFDPPRGMTRHEMAFASILGSYLSSSLDESMDPEVFKVQVQPSGLDPLGEISTGFISMNCVGLLALIIPDPRSSGFQEDHKVLIVVARHNFPSVPWPFDGEQVGNEGVIDSVEDISIPMCVCIPIARRQVEYIDNVAGLLITSAPGATDIFRRIGISWMPEEMAIKLFSCWRR